MSPRSAKLNEELRAESQARILESALTLFAQHGYDRTSVASIAKAAGMSQGLIYHYYQSKDDILRALFEQSMTEIRTSFAEAEATRAPEEKIARLVRAAFNVVKSNLHFWRLSYALRMQPAVLDSLGQNVQGWTQAIMGKLTQYFREAGAPQPDIEAAMLFALIDGVAQHYALDPERYPLEAVTERITQTYRAGQGSNSLKGD